MKTSNTKRVKAFVVVWFGYVQPVGRRLPRFFETRREAKQAYGNEIIKVIPVTITYNLFEEHENQ